MPGQGEAVLTLADIAARLGGDVLGDAQTGIVQVASLAAAGAGQISFLANRKYRDQLATTRAAAVIVAPDMADAFAGPRIVTGNPYAYYARVAALLNPAATQAPGVHPSAVVESPLPASAVIGPHACIGRDVVLGERVVIHAGAVIGDGVSIGDDSLIYPNVTIYQGCVIGKRAIVHAGAVIGSDGFGFAPEGLDWIKIPQIGRVIIGDDVEFGASSTVDRGALEDTLIGDGCKIDNQVHIGHNCRIGPRSVLAGCTGVAGSTTFGEHVIIGGGGMISGHINLAGGVVVSGGTTVIKSIQQPGVYTSVFPLDGHEDWIRNASHIRRLAKMADRVAALEKKLKELEAKD